VIVKPTPVVPSPAATLVLLRDAPGGGFEVLLVQRHLDSKFAGGDFVFPGGKIAADDNPEDAVQYCAGLTGDEAARRLSLSQDTRAALGYWIGAIREVFEEVGLLLAYGPDGAWARVEAGRLEGYRQACQDDNRAFWDMIRAERLVLATDRLRYFAHWITPEENPIRFDTRFFASEAPTGGEPEADGHEIVAVRWLAPAEALRANERGEISLRGPTIANLRILAAASSMEAALGSLAGRHVTPIRPRVLMEGGKRRVLLPGDPGYF